MVTFNSLIRCLKFTLKATIGTQTKLFKRISRGTKILKIEACQVWPVAVWSKQRQGGGRLWGTGALWCVLQSDLALWGEPGERIDLGGFHNPHDNTALLSLNYTNSLRSWGGPFLKLQFKINVLKVRKPKKKHLQINKHYNLLSRCYLQIKSRWNSTGQTQAEVRQRLQFCCTHSELEKWTHSCPSLAETSICLNYSVCVASKLKSKKRLASKWKEKDQSPVAVAQAGEDSKRKKLTKNTQRRQCRDPPNPNAHQVSPRGQSPRRDLGGSHYFS